MAIISKIGRKSFRVRALLAAVYLSLILGSATMIYPFLLMLSGSTKGAVDIKYFNAVPRFVRDDAWLYRKHVEALFNERLLDCNATYNTGLSSFADAEPPEPCDELLKEWKQFLSESELPGHCFTIGHLQSDVARTIPMHLRRFKASLRTNYGKSIDAINEALGTEFIDWTTVVVKSRLVLSTRDAAKDTPFGRELAGYKLSVPQGMRVYASPEGFFRNAFIKARYSANIDVYNEEHATDYSSYSEVRLSRTCPTQGNGLEKSDWEDFVRHTLAPVWITASEGAAPEYRAFLKAKYQSVDILNRSYGTDHSSFGEAPLPQEAPPEGLPRTDWEAFAAGWHDPVSGRTFVLPLDQIRISSVETAFRDWLQAKYLSVERLEAATGISHASFEDIVPPQQQLHYEWFTKNRRALRSEFLTRNYRTVFEYLVLHGRGVLNTFIYCALAILCALIINPMAAYAMSRYRMPSTYKILLFLMCTMAFPPMVTQIPNFLMLRKLGLLNTFAALVLPGMANGYSIFLLKGFFDSQPRELYESAQLDGAGEWTIFWQITMSLSKPILAVIALQAFTLAYSNFMFAFIVCQDQKMWTLMVWLYQLQQRSGQAVMYASLIIAALPTFLIFLFCQKIIMRGIVVPSEK